MGGRGQILPRTSPFTYATYPPTSISPSSLDRARSILFCAYLFVLSRLWCWCCASGTFLHCSRLVGKFAHLSFCSLCPWAPSRNVPAIREPQVDHPRHRRSRTFDLVAASSFIAFAAIHIAISTATTPARQLRPAPLRAVQLRVRPTLRSFPRSPHHQLGPTATLLVPPPTATHPVHTSASRTALSLHFRFASDFFPSSVLPTVIPSAQV